MISIKRYGRIYNQLEPLIKNSTNLTAQIATINAVLYNKLDYVFWIGVYFVKGEQMVVGPYQGPLACQVLTSPNGVCWASVIQKKTVIVPDVNKFPGHIACDSRSKSELVIPVFKDKEIIAVMDIDSDKPDAFQPDNVRELEKIISLLNTELPVL